MIEILQRFFRKKQPEQVTVHTRPKRIRRLKDFDVVIDEETSQDVLDRYQVEMLIQEAQQITSGITKPKTKPTQQDLLDFARFLREHDRLTDDIKKTT